VWEDFSIREASVEAKTAEQGSTGVRGCGVVVVAGKRCSRRNRWHSGYGDITASRTVAGFASSQKGRKKMISNPHAGYQYSSIEEKIMKAAYPLAVIATTFALAGCSPNIDKARAEYCKDLGAYAKTVAAVGALGPDSTVSDFRKAEKDEEEAYAKLTKAAFRLSEAQDAAIRKVKESFAKTVNDIQGNEKLGAAATTVQQATAQALSQYSDIASTTCAYGAPQTS